MSIKFLGDVAKIDPALARALEIGLYSVSIYVLSFLTGYHEVLSLLLLPIIAYVQKRKRDEKKEQKEFLERNQ